MKRSGPPPGKSPYSFLDGLHKKFSSTTYIQQNTHSYCRGTIKKDEHLKNNARRVAQKSKGVPLESIMCSVHHQTTVNVGARITRYTETFYEMINEKGSFAEDMAQYDKPIPWRALQACIFVFHESHRKHWRNLIIEICQTLFHQRCVETVDHAAFHCRMTFLPYRNVMEALLKELGYYYTVIRAMEQDVRKYCNVASRLLPPFFDDEDRLLACHALIDEEWKSAPVLEQYYEATLYQKAFLSRDGFYGVFFMYVEIILEFLTLYGKEKEELLLKKFWKYDIDVRSPFKDMIELMNFPKSDVTTEALTIILESEEFKCYCSKTVSGGESTVIFKWCPDDAKNRLENCDDAHPHYYSRGKRCDSAKCFNIYMIMMSPELRALGEKVIHCDGSEKQLKRIWQDARKKLDLCAALIELSKLQDALLIKDKELSKLKTSSAWINWNAEKKVRFCWYCYKSTKNLKLCSSCRRARYCSDICSSNHWPLHNNYCRDKMIHRLFPSVDWKC